MFREIEHVLRDLYVLDIVKIFRSVADLVGVAQQHAHQPLVAGFQRDDMLAVGQHDAAIATLSSERIVSRITA
jgi:hypothetical protein